MSLYGSALQSLKYNPHAKASEETKFGYFIYDGSALDDHHCRYRTQLKVDAASEEKMAETMLNFIESLRGQALNQALNNDEVLAVAFQYTINNVIYLTITIFFVKQYIKSIISKIY